MTQAGIQEKIDQTRKLERGMDKGLNQTSNLRLFLALAVVFGIVGYVRYDSGPALGLAVVAGVLFFVYVRRYNRQQGAKDILARQREVLDRYLARYDGRWKGFAEDGADFTDATDTLSLDLDLFGPGSLFQYLNVGTSLRGKEALARLLRKPHLGYIEARQASVKELLADEDFIIAFEAFGATTNKRHSESERKAEKALLDFAQSQEEILPKGTPIFLILIPLLTLGAWALAFLGHVSYILPVTMVALQMAPSIMMSGPINQRKEALFQFKRQLSGLQSRLALLMRKDFQSSYLTQMQEALADADQGIRRIRAIADRWQLRENFVLYLPLVGLFLWDFQALYALEKWRKTYGESYPRWMAWIGEVEALASLGTMGRINPEATVFPEIAPGPAPELVMVDGKHPLIEPDRVVGNDYRQGGETVIITGSNMSGKSTFMRTVALNTVLAYAGGVVNAKSFRVSPMRIFSSMRVQDDVDAGISTFYGEILRIKDMVTYADRREPMLVVIDEIFKGTNSADRIIGAEATIKKLSRPWIMTMVTTHDFELCALVEDEAVQGKNYHFEEYYEGEEILFDYKIRPGRTQTTNAKFLMRMTGLLDEEA